jgi:hypothetical protein
MQSAETQAISIGCSRPPPKEYAAADRAKKVRQALASSSTVTEALYDAGFNSGGRFYERATDMLGMAPSQYCAEGTNEQIKFAVGQTSLGAILVASTTKGVAAILFGDDPDELVRDLRTVFQKRISLVPIETTSHWSRGLLASLRRRGLAWIFLSTHEAPPSSNVCGRLSRRFPSARRSPMPRSPNGLVRRRPCAGSPARAP